MERLKMTELQKRVRILIEQSEYEKATEVFLFETGAKVSINYKGYFINPLWNEDTPRPKYSVCVSRGRSHFFITFWGNLKGDEVTSYDVLACLQKYPCDDYEDFCNDYGFDIYDDFEGGYNKQSRKIWKACVNEYAKVEKLFSEEELDALREIA